MCEIRRKFITDNLRNILVLKFQGDVNSYIRSRYLFLRSAV